jgi:hypothetical protein
MKATEIVSKLKDVLLSSTEEVETQEAVQQEVQEDVQEEVQLEAATEEVTEEEVQLEEAPEVEASEEVEAMEPKSEMSYATKEELAEVKAMVEKLMGQLEAKEESKQEVPQELSADEAPLTHSPENATETKNLHLYSQNAPATTLDRVLARLNK